MHGRNLRHAALVVLHRHGAASIGEILEILWANDFRVTGSRVEMGKRLSDALRHEVRLGRARRVGWGRYAVDRLARTTRYRITRRWRLAAPARRDASGEPVLEGRAPDDRIGETPWSRHDRHAHQLWSDNFRIRWQIGRHVHGARLAAQRIERRAGGPPAPEWLTRTREAHLAEVCARSSPPAAAATRWMATQPTARWG